MSVAQPAPPLAATGVAAATERLVDVPVGTLGELDVMGESCLVQEGHRDATVTATEAVQALSLHRDDLARLPRSLHDHGHTNKPLANFLADAECDDGDVCTIDSCDAKTGPCSNVGSGSWRE